MDPTDGGMQSRKLLLAGSAMILMSVAWFLTGKWTALAVTYDSLIGGLLGVLGLFIVGNVATKHVISKTVAGVSFQGEVSALAPAPTESSVAKTVAPATTTKK